MSQHYLIHYRHNDIPFELRTTIPECDDGEVLKHVLNAISNDLLKRNGHKGIDGFRELVVYKIISEDDEDSVE